MAKEHPLAVAVLRELRACLLLYRFCQKFGDSNHCQMASPGDGPPAQGQCVTHHRLACPIDHRRHGIETGPVWTLGPIETFSLSCDGNCCRTTAVPCVRGGPVTSLAPRQ